QTRGVSQAGLRRATLYRVRAGSNPARPAKLYGAVAERLGTGLSIQPTRVRVSSAPPTHTRCKLNRHEHPPLKRGVAGSSPARRIDFSECSLGETEALGLGPRRRGFESHHSAHLPWT